jgi:Reverse transcriptase (RNA-dependent DNA polymerase)
MANVGADPSLTGGRPESPGKTSDCAWRSHWDYADDLMICCRGSAEEALRAMRTMMERLKLTVNESKTRLCRLPDDSFDFLGYTIGRCWSAKTGRAYLGTRPSKWGSNGSAGRSASVARLYLSRSGRR